MNDKKGSLGLNALLNAIKQGCGVLFPFLSFAYCSRIIGKEGIGVYSFAQSVVAYFILIAGLGISNYAIREGAMVRDDKKKVSLFVNQVFTINIIAMVISYMLLIVIVLIVPKFVVHSGIIAILSTQLLLNTIGADWINTIYEDYLYLTVRYIVFQIIAFAALLLFVHNESDLIIYTWITMLSNVGGNIVNLFYLRKQGIYPTLSRHIDIKRHFKSIIILFANNISGIIYLNSDITMLGFILSEADVGVYTIASKIYTLVKTLINAVIMVTVPRFSYYIANNKAEEYKLKINDIINVLIIIIMPCVVGMITEADKILLIFAGRGYESGDSVVRILGISLIFAVGACFFSYSILLPNKREREFMNATIIAAFVNIVLNVFVIQWWGIVGAAVSTLIAECFVVGIAIRYSKSIILPRIDIRSLLSVIVGSIAILIICKSVDALISTPIYAFLTELFISILGYILCLLFLKNRYVHSYLDKVKNKISMLN